MRNCTCKRISTSIPRGGFFVLADWNSCAVPCFRCLCSKNRRKWHSISKSPLSTVGRYFFSSYIPGRLRSPAPRHDPLEQTRFPRRFGFFTRSSRLFALNQCLDTALFRIIGRRLAPFADGLNLSLYFLNLFFRVVGSQQLTTCFDRYAVKSRFFGILFRKGVHGRELLRFNVVPVQGNGRAVGRATWIVS